jgi:hypothetical protein
MTRSENVPHVGRRSVLAGVAGSLGAAAALPATAAQAAPREAVPAGGHPSNWPDPQPYGLADTRPDLWPREDNSFVLPLEMRPRDEERGQVWMRDTYVNCFVADGRPVYVATGTTRVPGLDAAAPWNDGIFLWVSPSLHGPWRLADTTGIRPGAEKGKVWSPEFAGENRPGRTVVAPWQEYWHDDRFGKRGQVWAPEVHYFRGTWYIVACMGDHAQKVGSFLLVSEGGVEGPYSRRWTLGVGAGHNNLFADHRGRLWATFFRNPNAGYWSDPARVADTAVPGVVQLEWTGPQGDRLYVRRRNRGRTLGG